MSNNKYTGTKISKTINLIGEKDHRTYIQLQAEYGFSQRGGVQFPFAGHKHVKRLVNDVNILTSKENKQLIFSESIYCN